MCDVYFCINNEEFWGPETPLAPEFKQLQLGIQMLSISSKETHICLSKRHLYSLLAASTVMLCLSSALRFCSSVKFLNFTNHPLGDADTVSREGSICQPSIMLLPADCSFMSEQFICHQLTPILSQGLFTMRAEEGLKREDKTLHWYFPVTSWYILAIQL